LGELLVGAMLAGVVFVLSLVCGSVLDLINNARRGKLRGCFVRFNTEINLFEFSSHLSAFNSSWGSGAISDIRYISIDNFISSSGSPSTWDVIIRTDRSYRLSWSLRGCLRSINHANRLTMIRTIAA